MTVFWKRQREAIGVRSQRQMATLLGVSNEAVRGWELDLRSPALPVKFLAEKYRAPEAVIEREIMAQRRRIEAREAAAASA